MIRVTEVATVTKNSVRLTDPITKRGTWPVPTRVEVTIGPHPPPPMASSMPPPKPMTGIPRLLGSTVAKARSARARIRTPIKAR